MDDSNMNNDLEVEGLRLIDVSSEDDCLLQSSENQQEHRTFDLLEAGDASEVEDMVDTLEQRERVPQPIESLGPEARKENDKYNLRKSLAWDNAFFTNAGVLDPEELSSIIDGVEKGGKRVLPSIQEDIYRSTESISTIESDSLTLESLETDLFEDIRASIQKSSKLSNVSNSSIKAESGVTETQTTRFLKKEDITSRNKMQSGPAIKKPNTKIEGSGKTTKQVPVRSQVSQRIVTSGKSSSLLPKPPKVVGRANSISTTSTKRASLGTNQVRMDKDSAKSTIGRGASVSKAPALGARAIVPRPRPSTKSSSLGSSTAKTELTSTRSSFGSSGSAASDKIGISPLNSIPRKIDSGIVSSSSGSTVRTPSRNKSQSGNSHLSAAFMTIKNLSSSISPVSSISEWSSDSSCSTSVNQRSNTSRASLDTSSCKGISVNSDAPRVLGSQKNSTDQGSVRHEIQVPGLMGRSVKKASVGTGTLNCPASGKPSGLRLPSPKIGFFDGVKSGVRTPNGSMQFHPGVPSGLAKVGSGTGSVSPSGGLSNTKLGKHQPGRTVTAIRNKKSDTQQTTLSGKIISPIPHQETSNASTKVSSVSRNVKSSPGIFPKVQNKNSPESGGESHLKSGVGIIGCDIAKHDAVSALIAEKNGSIVMLRNKVSPEIKGSAHGKDSKITRSKREMHSAYSDSNSVNDVENIAPSQNVDKDAVRNENYLKNKHSYNCDEMEKAHFENQVDGLCRHVEAVDINAKIHKERTGSTELEVEKTAALTLRQCIPKENSRDVAIN